MDAAFLKLNLVVIVVFLLAFVGLAADPSGDVKFAEFKAKMVPQLGHEVTVTGKLENGMQGWWLSFDSWGLYIKLPTTNNDSNLAKFNALGRFQHHTVKAVGVLKLLKASKPKDPMAQGYPEDFYFDVADVTVTDLASSSADSEAVQRERLYQQFLVEIRQMRQEMRESAVLTNANLSGTNFDTQFRWIFDQMLVDPSFGLRWDGVPPPTIVGLHAMDRVDAFIATNGWNMEREDWRVIDMTDNDKPIRGLPWAVIQDREFQAVTHGGILYVMFSGWHHNCSGVAYNPATNAFPKRILGFKPIGEHWYVWAEADSPLKLVQEYEGQIK